MKVAGPTKGRGGREGHEPRKRIHLRELRVMELVLQGTSQHQIAEQLGISQPAVSKIVRRVEERLLAEVAEHAERQRARQTLRLEHLYGEAMHAWAASKQDVVRRRQRKTDRASGTGDTVAELTSESQHGHPRYLDEARKTLADLRRVWGVDAPTRVAVSAEPFGTWTDEALEQELARQLARLTPATVIDVTPASPDGASDDEA